MRSVERLGSLEVDVAVADLYGVDLDGVGGVGDALAGGQVVDLLVEGGGDGGVAVLLADDTACEDQCLAVRVEVVAGEDAVLGLVDGVLVAVDQGDFAPVFFEVRFSADAYPVLSPGGFLSQWWSAPRGVQDTIAVRVFFVWSLPYETHIWKWGTRRVLKVIFTLKDDLKFYRLALPKLGLDKVRIPYSSPVFRGFFGKFSQKIRIFYTSTPR